MPKKISQKFNKKGRQTLFNSSQQKASALKKVQNEKTPKLTNYKDTLKSSCKFSNNTNLLFGDNVISSNSNDKENEESKEHEFNKDESGNEDIIMQDVESTSSEEEDSTNSSDNEDMKKINYSEEETEESEEDSNVESMDEKELDETDDEDDEDDEDGEMDEIVEDTTKISLKKKAKEKGEIKSQDKTMSKETAEEKDPIPTPLLARPQAEKQFRDYYMNQTTKAFGEDLDKLRKKEVNLSSNKLEILIDTLESGISIFSDVEKELTLLSSNKK